MRGVDDLYDVIAFFEERRGRLHGFRWRDWSDYRSGAPGAPITASDQAIGTGDASETDFQLVKVYGSDFAPWTREIRKPIAGTIKVALDGTEQVEGADYTLDATTGMVSFTTAPGNGVAVTAGFWFDVPARFDTDRLEVSLERFSHGEIPNIPIVEVRL